MVDREREAVEILLVEDTASDAKLTLRALASNNLNNRVHVVTDGAEALDFVFCRGEYTERTPGQPKVILLDLNLPKVSGIEVLQQLKQDSVLNTIPVVVLTSSREDRDLAECYRLGVNSYIVKPVDFEKFTNAVREIGLYWLSLNQSPGWHAESPLEWKDEFADPDRR